MCVEPGTKTICRWFNCFCIHLNEEECKKERVLPLSKVRATLRKQKMSVNAFPSVLASWFLPYKKEKAVYSLSISPRMDTSTIGSLKWSIIHFFRVILTLLGPDSGLVSQFMPLRQPIVCKIDLVSKQINNFHITGQALKQCFTNISLLAYIMFCS